MDNFNEWLLEEMSKREWSQSDLARKAGSTRAAISLILSESRGPGVDLCIGIANAFNYPPEMVFRRAGILPQEPEESEQIKELSYLFSKFPDAEKVDLLNYMRIKLMMIESSK